MAYAGNHPKVFAYPTALGALITELFSPVILSAPGRSVVVKSQQERPFWLYTYAPPRSDIRVHREGCLHGRRKLIRGVWTGPLAEQLAMLPQHTLKWCYFCCPAGRL